MAGPTEPKPLHKLRMDDIDEIADMMAIGSKSTQLVILSCLASHDRSMVASEIADESDYDINFILRDARRLELEGAIKGVRETIRCFYSITPLGKVILAGVEAFRAACVSLNVSPAGNPA